MVSEAFPATISSPMVSFLREPKRYTLEEYLQREEKSQNKHEFIDGQIIRKPMAKGPHNIISVNITTALSNAVENLPLNYVIFSSDQKVYLPSLDESVYPDALAICERPIYWDKDKLLLINPILVVEVLSKSTQSYDRGGKFDKYKTLPTFKEYVLIRQDKCYAEVWFREKPGLWHETIVTDLESQLPLQSIGVSLSMERLYRNVGF